jgi:phosphatidylserine/phosphatidylglycerophosphate/cardiolipin synthase-like enzyme
LAQIRQKIVGGLNFAWAAEGMDPHCSVHLFPSAYHIKVAIKDHRAVWLSSGNWNQTNQPNITPVTTPSQRAGAATWDRDWHVIVDNVHIAGVFEAAVLRDLAQAKPGQRTAASKAGTVARVPAGKPMSTFFPAKTFTGSMTVQPVLTPDNYADVIIPLILSAKQSFWMQTQYIHPAASFEKDMQKPLASRSILEKLITALATLQTRNLDIKIILGQTVTASQLEALQMYGKLDATSFRLQDNVHNKGMIIDGKTVVIGSQNWSTEGVDTNRDASVVIQSAAIAAYWKQIFLLDWNERTQAPDKPAS